MINHCRPYNCGIHRILLSVGSILIVMLHLPARALAESADKPGIAILGDSMSWIGGDCCQNDTGWTHYLKDSGIAAKIDIYARSGATWTNTESTQRNPGHYTEILHDDNVVFNQAIRLIEKVNDSNGDPDIIVLFAGANDAWFAAKRPGLYENENPNERYSSATDPAAVTSLEGSIHLVGELLKQRFPNAALLFVTPLQMAKTDEETIFRISDIIEKKASDMGWPTLRADKETGITHRQEAKTPKYTYDGVHTNPDGAKILGEYIIKHLQSLRNYQTTPPCNSSKSPQPSN